MTGTITLDEARGLAERLTTLVQHAKHLDEGLDLVAIAAGNGARENGVELLQKAQRIADLNRADLNEFIQYLADAYVGDAQADLDLPDEPVTEPDEPVDLSDDDVVMKPGPDVKIESMDRWKIDNWQRKDLAPHARQEGDTCVHYENGVDLHNVYVHGMHRCAFQHWSSRGRIDEEALFRNCVFHARTWGFRDYRIARGLQFVQCRFGPVKQEHGYYGNLEGGFPDDMTILFDRVLWEDIASQAVQLVSPDGRRHEYPDDVDLTPGGLIIYRDSLARNVSNDMEDGRNDAVGGGTSYVFSHFRAMHPVQMKRTSLDNSMLSEASGWLLCEGSSDPTYDRVLEVDGGEDRSFVDLPNNNRSIAKINAGFGGSISGAIRNMDFRNDGGQRNIDLMGKVEDFVIEDCDGNAVIRVDGKVHGPVSQGIQL